MPTLDNPTDVNPDEMPFYENSDSSRTKRGTSYVDNTQTIANFRVSRYSAPVPNTLVPIGPAGLLPASVIPAVPATTIYSRDGLHSYSLVVEADGALSIDRLT